MTTEQKVRYAIALDRKIAQLESELGEIKADLIKIAESPAFAKTPTECGGWSADLIAANGEIARVTCPADKLKASIDADSEEWQSIIELLGPARFIYFPIKVETVRRPVPSGIRDALLAQGKIKARKVLKLITTKSKPTVSFETKEAS